MKLTEKAMLVNLSISQWTARKYDRKVSREVNESHGASDDAGRYNKSLVARDSLKELQKIVNKARVYHYENTLPWFDEGSRILPASLFVDYSAKMRELRSRFENEIAVFADNYPSLIEQARKDLNGLFNESDYPGIETIKGKFGWTIAISPLPTSDDFRVSLSDEEVKKIRSEIEARSTKAVEIGTKDLWERLYKVVNHMVEKLSVPDAIFRDSLVNNVAELTSLLPKLNIGDDASLEEARKAVEIRLANLDPEMLRKDETARAETAKDAAAILDAMKAYTG